MDQLTRDVPDKPQLAPGVRLAGQLQESAFERPPWLIERQGQGYLQVPKPLYDVAEHADGQHTLTEIAEEVAHTDGRRLSADNVRYLIATQLIPSGVMSSGEGKTAAAGAGSARSALAIARLFTFDADALAGITGALQVLFWPVVLAVVLALGVLTQGWLYVVHGVGASLHDAFYVPGFMLLMLVSVLVSAGFHELGHAAALRYGGGKPRTFGSGMYLMYPAALLVASC